MQDYINNLIGGGIRKSPITAGIRPSPITPGIRPSPYTQPAATVPSNPGATAPASRPISSPVTDNRPTSTPTPNYSSSSYSSNTAPSTTQYSSNPAYKDLIGAIQAEQASRSTGGTSTTGAGVGSYKTSTTSAPDQQDSEYIKYLKTLFNPEMGRQNMQERTTANKRLADIQNREDKLSLESRREQQKLLDKSGGLVSGAAQSAQVAGRRSDAQLADLAVQESAAARTAQVANDTFKAYIDAGKSIDEATAAATKAKNDAAFNLSAGEDRYALNPTTGQYEKIASGSPTASSSGGFTLSPGENRYDSSGKLVASGGPKPLSQAQETAQIAQNDKEKAAQQQASQSIGIVNDLLNSDTDAITGIGQNPFNFLGLSNQKAVNQYNQLQGLLKLGIRGLLKGQGAVSDYEGKILGEAASSLGRNLPNTDFKQALKNIRGTLKTNNGQPTDVTVVNPKTGEALNTTLSGPEIFDLVSEGNLITYQ